MMFTSTQSSKTISIPENVAYIRVIQNDLFTLNVEIDVQGDITVRDVQLDPSTGQIVELNRVARGAQFFETLSWLSQ